MQTLNRKQLRKIRGKIKREDKVQEEVVSPLVESKPTPIRSDVDIESYSKNIIKALEITNKVSMATISAIDIANSNYASLNGIIASLKENKTKKVRLKVNRDVRGLIDTINIIEE